MEDVLKISSVESIEGYEHAFQWLDHWIKKYPVVLLYGQLGSGKTTFVQAFCKKYFDIHDTSSPTYAIINMYKGKEEVAHADLYRLDTIDELVDIGFEDLLDRGIPTFIEWPEKALPLVDDHIEVRLKAEKSGERSLKARVIPH